MTKLLILSDLHLEFGPFIPTIPEDTYDIVVLAGDIEVGHDGIEWAKYYFKHKPVVYVAGNHEFYLRDYPGVYEDCYEVAEGSNVRFLENDSCIIQGVEFLGCTLWTDFNLYGTPMESKAKVVRALNDFRIIRGFSGDVCASASRKSQNWLERRLYMPHEGPRVVVTHHGPSKKSVHPKYAGDPINPGFSNDLDYLVELAGENGANLWIQGHTHESLDYTIKQCRVVCNPFGYLRREENPNFNPNLIIEV